MRAVLPLAFNFSAYFSSEIEPLEEGFQYAMLGNTLSVHTIIAHYNSGSHLPVCFLSLHVEMRLHFYFWIDKKKGGFMPTLYILRSMYASMAFSYVHAKNLVRRGHQHHIIQFQQPPYGFNCCMSTR